MYGYFSYLTYQLFTYSDNLRTCPDGQYLNMPLLIVSAPMSCVPCHITCKSCLIADMTNYSLTQSNCLSCYGERYLNLTDGIRGYCNCSSGNEIAGVCQDCIVNCFVFDVDFISATYYGNFLLRFSAPTNITADKLSTVLTVSINNHSTSYSISELSSAAFKVTFAL